VVDSRVSEPPQDNGSHPVIDRRASEPPRQELPQTVIDTRRYRWAIGIFGLALLVAFSVVQFVRNGVGTPGVAVGKRLHFFAAPLATSTLNGDANLNPPCTLSHHDPRALNVCLLAQRGPLVLAFFVTDSKDCKREIDTMQTVASEVPPGEVQFAAVAVRAGRSAAAAAVRSHHWTIPVAFDRDGAVGALYDVAICPMLELTRRGGVVADLLIGDHWLLPGALATRVRALLR
jgi:peroxiredoxin